MTEQNVNIAFDANIDNLLASMKVAKSAVDDTFNFERFSTTGHMAPVVDLFRNVERSSDLAIAGMIKGTESWQSAFARVATNLEIRFAQLTFNKVLSWALSESAMTAATLSGNALRIASDEEAGAASLASKAQRAIASIFNDAKEVFGGIFAFLSPVMGPAAVGPAAAGSATVASLASDIVFAETGAWHIPSNTLAYLHAGEMVVPQPFADSLRNAGGIGGGGGDSYSITIQAIDTQSGAQFLKNNASAIASAISGQVRNFNRNVPAWKS